MKPYKIGIDLGGTKTEVIILDTDDNEFYRKRVPTKDKDDYQKILLFVHNIILETIDKIPTRANCTIGVGIPGSINTETELVQNANTTCLIGNPFQKDLEKLLTRKVAMENDANCFTLAESLSGAVKGYHFVFGIIMGTGCGGGICINGNVLKGVHGIAGEWGHFSVDPLGDKCYCGNLGCVLFKKFNIRMKMHEIVQGARDNDAKCYEAFEQFLDDFGRCVGGLISILDPDAIVIEKAINARNPLRPSTAEDADTEAEAVQLQAGDAVVWLPDAEVIESGVNHVVKRQQQGWSYIRV